MTWLDSPAGPAVLFVPASGRQYTILARAFARMPSGVSFIAENGSLGFEAWARRPVTVAAAS